MNADFVTRLEKLFYKIGTKLYKSPRLAKPLPELIKSCKFSDGYKMQGLWGFVMKGVTHMRTSTSDNTGLTQIVALWDEPPSPSGRFIITEPYEFTLKLFRWLPDSICEELYPMFMGLLDFNDATIRFEFVSKWIDMIFHDYHPLSVSWNGKWYYINDVTGIRLFYSEDVDGQRVKKRVQALLLLGHEHRTSAPLVDYLNALILSDANTSELWLPLRCNNAISVPFASKSNKKFIVCVSDVYDMVDEHTLRGLELCHDQ